MKYTNWLAGTRNWLAGGSVTYADLAAAATLSVLDYLGEIDWAEDPPAQANGTRGVKSRPSLPAAARRPRARPAAGVALCGPRFLKRPATKPAQRRSIARRSARASTSSRVTTPDADPAEAPERLAALRRRRPSRHDGLARRDARRGAATARRCGRRCARSSCSASTTGRTAIRCTPRRSGPRHDLGLCAATATITTSSRASSSSRRHASPRAPAPT